MEQKSLDRQFLDMYDQFADDIFRHCFFRVSDRDTALDLTQDIFMNTWKHVKKGNDIEDVRAFLYKTANNRIIDYYRKKKSLSLDKLVEQSEGAFQPEGENTEDIERVVEQREVRELLVYLDEPYRQAVTLRYVDGLQPQDIAEIVGDNVNTVSVRITRGVEKLKQYIQEHGI